MAKKDERAAETKANDRPTQNEKKPNPGSKDPLHGVTLKALLEELVAKYGFEYLGQAINIRCFNDNPSIKSSLTFLRKTPWAREKVEALYLASKVWDNTN